MEEDKLFCMEEIPTAHFLVVHDMMHAYTKEFSDFGLPNFKESVAHWKDNTFYMCFRHNEFKEVGKAIMQKMLSDPEWFDKLDNTNYNLNKTFFKMCKGLVELDPKPLTNKQISSLLKAFFEVKTRSHIIGQVSVVLEFEFQHYTNHMLNLLKKKIEPFNLNHDPIEVFNLMTTPRMKSIVVKEEIDLLKLAQKARKDDLTEKEIETHFKKYRWINYMFVGPTYKKDYFTERIEQSAKSNINLEKEIKQLQDKTPTQEQKILEKELKLTEHEKRLFEFGRRLLYTKVFRKDALVHGFFSVEKILEEAAKRLDLTFTQIRYLKNDELINALKGKELKKEELDKRVNLSTLIVKPDKEEILFDKAAENYVKDIFTEIKEQINELKGMPACKGKASGSVRIINTIKDLDKMQQGDILFSICTNPDLVPAMKKASAIVTDVGGISCHAAIVSREMGTPCVIGTKLATKAFKDGDLVEVDANQGIIRRIK